MKRLFALFLKLGWIIPLFLWGAVLNDYLIQEVHPRLIGDANLNTFPYLVTLANLFRLSWVWAMFAAFLYLFELRKSK